MFGKTGNWHWYYSCGNLCESLCIFVGDSLAWSWLDIIIIIIIIIITIIVTIEFV